MCFENVVHSVEYSWVALFKYTSDVTWLKSKLGLHVTWGANIYIYIYIRCIHNLFLPSLRLQKPKFFLVISKGT